MNRKIGIAGLGALGSAVARALQDGIDGMDWVAASEVGDQSRFDIDYTDFAGLAHRCDLIVECLPAEQVFNLAQEVFRRNKDMIIISSAALLLHPEILEAHRRSRSRILVPAGALAGMDGVGALKEMGIESAVIRTTKPPRGLQGAPYVIHNHIDLNGLKEKTQIFSGNAFEAAQGFPANVNVAATLSLAGIGPERTMVEVWADPHATTNTHEIEVASTFSILRTRIENKPDPANPKSSMLAAQSIVSTLKGLSAPLVVL